jgi:hypothetical protein
MEDFSEKIYELAGYLGLKREVEETNNKYNSKNIINSNKSSFIQRINNVKDHLFNNKNLSEDISSNKKISEVINDMQLLITEDNKEDLKKLFEVTTEEILKEHWMDGGSRRRRRATRKRRITKKSKSSRHRPRHSK